MNQTRIARRFAGRCAFWHLHALLSQDQCAKKLGVSKSHLCDVEKGRKLVGPERAAKWARILGHPESVLIRFAIQGELDAAGLKYRVDIEAA